MGIGETVKYDLRNRNRSIRAGDLLSASELERKLTAIQSDMRLIFKGTPVNDEIWKHLEALHDEDAPHYYADVLSRDLGNRVWMVDSSHLKQIASEKTLIFEGAQGVLLDENHGFHPHTTWSKCVPTNALELLRMIGHTGEVKKLGVLRAYLTRHGRGPFPTEDSHLHLKDPNNETNKWQGRFKFGWFDMVLARYALKACGGVDSVAITCMDQLSTLPKAKICAAYSVPLQTETIVLNELSVREEKENQYGQWDLNHQEGLEKLVRSAHPIYSDVPSDPDIYVRTLERGLNTTVSVISSGPTAQDKVGMP
jgi:adenylosuccinate synthase